MDISYTGADGAALDTLLEDIAIGDADPLDMDS